MSAFFGPSQINQSQILSSRDRSIIRKEDDVDGRASVTKDEERVLRGG